MSLTQLAELELSNIRDAIDLTCFTKWCGGPLRIRVDRRTTTTGADALPCSVRVRRI